MFNHSRLLPFVIWAFVPVCAALAEPTEIRLGVIQSLTGAAEEDGQTILRALRMAADVINKTGEIKISLVVEDDGTVAKNSLSAYEKMKTAKVAAIVGPAWSFLVRTLAPLAARDGVVLFTTSNAPEVLDYAEAGGNLFSNSFTIKSVAAPLSVYLENKNLKNAAFVRTATVWAEAHKASMLPVLEQHQVALFADILTPEVSNNDFREVLPRLKAGKVDLVILLLSRDDSESFLRRASEIQYHPGLFAAAHTYDALNRTKNIGLYEGLCLAYPYRQLRANSYFFQQFKRSYGEEPRIYADTSYDAAFIIARAIQSTRQTGQSLPSALKATRYSGVAGEYAYSPNESLSTGRNDLLCVKNGAVVEQH